MLCPNVKTFSINIVMIGYINHAGLRDNAKKGLYGQVEEKKEKTSLYSSTRVVFIQVEVTVQLQW